MVGTAIASYVKRLHNFNWCFLYGQNLFVSFNMFAIGSQGTGEGEWAGAATATCD